MRSGLGSTKCSQGSVIRDTDVIRLEHINTGKYLHSHLHQSPLSGQQEVSAYLGSDGRGDTGMFCVISISISLSCIINDSNSFAGDNWRVEVNGGGAWKRGEPVRLVHVDTNKYLYSHNQKVPLIDVWRGGKKKTDHHQSIVWISNCWTDRNHLSLDCWTTSRKLKLASRGRSLFRREKEIK